MNKTIRNLAIGYIVAFDGKTKSLLYYISYKYARKTQLERTAGNG